MKEEDKTHTDVVERISRFRIVPIFNRVPSEDDELVDSQHQHPSVVSLEWRDPRRLLSITPARRPSRRILPAPTLRFVKGACRSQRRAGSCSISSSPRGTTRRILKVVEGSGFLRWGLFRSSREVELIRRAIRVPNPLRGRSDAREPVENERTSGSFFRKGEKGSTDELT